MFIKGKASDMPKRNRAEVQSPFEKTAEWKKMKKAIDAGLKPESKPGKDDADAVSIGFTEAEKAAIGLKARRTYFRFVQDYIKANNLPYTVTSYRSGDKDYIQVEG